MQSQRRRKDDESIAFFMCLVCDVQEVILERGCTRGPINRQRARKQALLSSSSFSNPRYSPSILMSPAILYDPRAAPASAVKIRRCSLSNARIPTPKWSKFAGNLSLWTRVFFLPMGGGVWSPCDVKNFAFASLERQVGMCDVGRLRHSDDKIMK
jgi:hypothetical protein